MADVTRKNALDGEASMPLRKKLRPTELPLSQTKRSDIDNLVHTFRKKGQYDSIRKELMAKYVSGPPKDELVDALKDLVDSETDRNPSLLSKDPRMATTLIEGAGERSDIYGNIMNTVNTLLDELIEKQGLPKMREFRVQEIGEEAAAEEELRGSKTEEEWALEADARRQERDAIREQEHEREREQEREERARKEERRRREREEDEARERVRQEEKERRRKERDDREREEEERRRLDKERIEKEREEERLRIKKERDEHEKSREARLKKIREEDAERERRLKEHDRELDRERERDRDRDRDRNARYRGSRARTRTPDPRGRERSRTRSRSREHTRAIKQEEIKVDDDLALQLLLEEGEKIKKASQRPALERSESLEPPSRKAHPPKSLVPRDPVSARLTKLDSTAASPVLKPITPTATIKNGDTPMVDAPPSDSNEAGKSRWDHPPELPSKGDKSRGRSRSRSVARSVSMRKRSEHRSHSRGSRYDRSRIDDDRRSRREDDRNIYRPQADSRRRDRDDRDDRTSRRTSRSRSRDAHSRRKSRFEDRSVSPERRRDRSRSRTRSRDNRRTRDYSPQSRRRNRSRTHSPNNIDRYIPGGGRKRDDSRDRKRDDSRPRKRDDSRDRARNYRSRDYDRWEGGRDRVSRRQESDCYQPGGSGRGASKDRDDRKEVDKSRDRSRDRSRRRSRERSRDRDRDRDRDRGRDERDRRRQRSRSRSRRR